jgi:SAM-dependent methyltransferase
VHANQQIDTDGFDFQCNICGESNRLPLKTLSREMASCRRCHSTPRWRALVSVLSIELLGRSLILPDFPSLPQVRGIGLEDWPGYANILAKKFAYTNTFHDREPQLDLTSPPEPDLQDSCDFVLSSDVFQFIPAPVERFLSNCLNLLKPGGVLVLTVPYSLESRTLEYFPPLGTYSVIDLDGEKLMINRTKSGKLQLFDNLRFPDQALMPLMRLFSRDGLVEALSKAGFVDIDVVLGDEGHGARWNESWSLPLVARRPS